MQTITNLKLERSKLYIKAFKLFPNSPKQLKVRAAIDSFAIFLFCSCTTNKTPEYFKQGQVLLPDYAIRDTLIVIDAEGLNKATALFEQGTIDATDQNISDIFYHFCIKK